MSAVITSGTADGMFAFLDYVKEKSYGTPGMVDPLKSAARRVIAVVEPDAAGDVEIRGLDLADFLERYETGARGQAMREETIAAYRSRFTRSVEAYLAYLDNGDWRRFFRPGKRADRGGRVGSPQPQPVPDPGAPQSQAPTPPDYLDYKFPLQGGRVAELRLPRELEKTDADRLARLIQSLVLEPQLALPPGSD